MRYRAIGLLLAGLALAPTTAHAGSILFTGSGPGDPSGPAGTTLSASALFQISGSTLTITLRNLGDNASTDVPGNTLTGVLFDLPNSISLTPVSATVAAGAIVQGSSCSPGPCNASTTNVGGEFRYDTAAAFPAASGADRGIASAGYIGGDGNFGGPNLDGPAAVNGMNFGIIGPGPFNPNGGNGNGGLANKPLIQDRVVFQMTIAGGTLTASQISNVSFQYGTGFSLPRIPGTPGGGGGSIPEPATVMMLAPALGILLRRMKRKAESPTQP